MRNAPTLRVANRSLGVVSIRESVMKTKTILVRATFVALVVLMATASQATTIMFGGLGGHSNGDSINDGALAIVDQADPENSLILRKPTSSSETEGVAGSAILAHGGGIRFTKDSPEYATILEWIKGAKE